ncbi:MAG: glycosyltransferase family 39 protein, partial [Candidatus Acidiferrales bacterium]
EYYSMPCYPALALLLGSAMTLDSHWVRRGTRALALIAGCAAVACFAILFLVRHVSTPGDISMALGHHPKAYTLSLGHMEDLTLDSFAYLRFPLALAGVAFLVGLVGTLRAKSHRAFIFAALMMVIFFHAARVAMVTFDPFLSSRPLARALMRSPAGQLIVNHHYYPYSSVIFYTDRPALLLNGRQQNLEYGSNAPGAPPVFIDDAQFKDLWLKPQRYYFLAQNAELPHFEELVGASHLDVVMNSGGKSLLTNLPIPGS